MKNIVHIPNIDSTNRELLRRVNDNKLFFNNLNKPYLLISDYQTGGRGQGSNRWESERGENILASFFFRPNVSAAKQFLFNQFFALTVRRFLLQYVPDVKIKWPNDIYVGDKKIAGILFEHTLLGEDLQYTIAGIGINVNQCEFSADIPNPTSLKMLTDKSYNVENLVNVFYEMVQSSYGRFQLATDEDALSVEYLSCLYRKGEEHLYCIRGNEVRATILGVDVFGRLRLTLPDGAVVECGLKEIVYC